MKILSKRKAWMLSSMLVLLFMKPMKAQYYDGFFHYKELSYEDRDIDIGFNIGTQTFDSDDMGGFNITTQVFGHEEAPLDGGLLIMFGAGSMYAVLKRKKTKIY